MQQADILLTVDLVELGVVVAQAGLWGECVAATGKVEMIALRCAIADIVTPGRVTQVGLGQTPGIDRQPVDFLAGQQATLEGR
ncbi:hypothetical protein D3C80_2030480 [compost metagenome]